MPKVSICIPTYRQTAHLRKTLTSVAEQTYRDVEVIISDDSPEGEVERLVKEFADTLPNLQYSRNKIALGPPVNWDHAIAMATGDYIKIMHHDDRFTSPGSLEVFMQAAERDDLDLVCCAAVAENEKNITTKLHAFPVSEMEQLFNRPHLLLFNNKIGPPSSILYKRSLGVIFDPDLRYLVDILFYHRILSATRKAAYIPEPLIASISGASHNVTNSCHTREIELKENLLLLQEWYSDFSTAERTALEAHFTGLFAKYGITSRQELLNLVPGLPDLEPLRKALSRINMNNLKQRIKQRIARSKLFKVMTGRQDRLYKQSYSQCGEDVIMDHVLSNLGVTKPFYVDIGAHHPQYLNNTYYFHLKGAQGVNIEPDPGLIEAFHKQRSKDLNLNIGVTDAPGTSEAELYIFNSPTLNTFSKEEAERIVAEHPQFKITKTVSIPIMNINDVFARHCKGQRIDILSVDVEGLDDQLMRAIDYSRYKPLMICLETISYSDTGQGVKNEALIEFIKGHGYMLYADTNINSIFVLEHMWKR